MSKVSKHLPTIINITLLMIGFGIGTLSEVVNPTNSEYKIPLNRVREISIVQFKERSGDQLKMEVSGNVRILFNDQTFEGEGEKALPLGQIPNQNDLKFERFAYVGNANTGKFYPASSQFARGTKYQHRRFFQSKKEAVKQGFKASKLVK